jgi:beta-glucosidase
MGVMAAYNDYGGVPLEANSLFLTKILRDQWGFRGYVVSDSGAVGDIYRKHRVAPTFREAIRLSVEAGLNVQTNFTQPEEYVKPLRQLVSDGELSTATIDSRVRDVLRVKFRLGLFDHPYVDDPDAADHIVDAPEHAKVAARAARESIVLLKNEGGVLPLSVKMKKVLVTGPLAQNKQAWWDRYGPQLIDYVTPLEGIKAKLGPGCEVRFVEGCFVVDERFPESDVYKEPPNEATQQRIDAAVSAAKDVDVIIAVLGESGDISCEDRSRVSLDLPGHQENLLRALQATGKPLVLVLSNGRPLSVSWAVDHVPAIVEMWFSNKDGGHAIADVLFGDYNPAGRLPITIPRTVGQIPIAFPVRPSAQARDGGQTTGPLYPFGHGLSYTSFTYANLRILPTTQTTAGNFEVTCDITNSGNRAGDEVVQLYLRDDYSSVTTFEESLCGFDRIHLDPSETKTLRFTLTPENLALYDQAGNWTVEPGSFSVMVGASSTDIRLRGQCEIIAPPKTASHGSAASADTAGAE